MEPREVLNNLNFGRVDAESDSRFESCFIGTDMLRHIMQPQHSLVLGSKGSGKSAAFRLLCTNKEKVRMLFPKGYDDIFCVPAYGLQNEEYVYGAEFRDVKSDSIDDFRYFWLLIIGIKAVNAIAEEPTIRERIAKSKKEELKKAYKIILQVVDDLGLSQERTAVSKMKQKIGQLFKSSVQESQTTSDTLSNLFSGDFKHKTGMSITAVLDNIDIILRETNCLAWMMLDKLDLLFIADFEKLKSSITGLVQLLIENINRFKNIHFKIFLRSDIFRQLRIVNKSHLVSYTSDMKWSDSLLLKLLISRAIADPVVQEYCEEQTGESVSVADIINGIDEDVLKYFYILFESTMEINDETVTDFPFLHNWMLKNLVDGRGNVYPREQILLGNLAVEKQIELNRKEGEHSSQRLISAKAVKEAVAALSIYRCDTYLYSEFPHLTKHFDVFRGSSKTSFTRDELIKKFVKLTPNEDEGIRAVYDTGLLMPHGRTVDSSMEFSIPLLYQIGLGMTPATAQMKSSSYIPDSSTAKSNPDDHS